MSTWEPGTVIADEDGSVFFIVQYATGVDQEAIDADGGHWRVETIDGARPLVVLDLHDMSTALRGVLLTTLRGVRHAYLDGVADSIAAQTRPPKPPNPPEPQGLGAVVEDVDGALWVRVNDVHFHSEASPNNRQTYAEIDVVRVLSEGIS